MMSPGARLGNVLLGLVNAGYAGGLIYGLATGEMSSPLIAALAGISIAAAFCLLLASILDALRDLWK
jgi:hypothetical protein